jgi:DNA polymerase-3 subunit chi
VAVATEVRFYVNLADRLGYACRLLRKAQGMGTPVVVTGEPPDLAALDQALWTFAPHDFVPHAVLGVAPSPVVARSSIVLAAHPLAAEPRALLVNLGGSVPEGFDQFARLFELVSADAADLAAARDRWKHYKAQGHGVEKHDVLAS